MLENTDVLDYEKLSELLDELHTKEFQDADGNSINVVMDISDQEGNHHTIMRSSNKNIAMLAAHLILELPKIEKHAVVAALAETLIKENSDEKECSEILTSFTNKGNA